VSWLKSYRRSIVHRISFSAAIIALLATVLISALCLVLAYQVLQQKLEEQLDKDLRIGQVHIQEKLNNLHQALFALSDDAILVNGLKDLTLRESHVIPLLKQAGLPFSDVSDLTLLNYDGRIIYEISSLGSQRVWLSQIDQQQEAFALITKNQDAHFDLTLIYPIKFPNRSDAQAYVAYTWPLMALLTDVLAPGRDPRSWNFLFDGQPTLPGFQYESHSQAIELELPKVFKDLKLSIALTQVGQPAFEAFYVLLPTFIALIVLIVVLVLWMSRRAARRIGEPINRLLAYTQEIASKGIPVRRLTEGGEDELANLMRHWNIMLDRLDQYQKGLEGQLLERGERLALIFELSPDGFLDLSSNLRVQYANPAFYSMTGLDPEKVKALDWHVIADLLLEKMPPFQKTDLTLPFNGLIHLQTPHLTHLKMHTQEKKVGGYILYWQDLSQEAELLRMRREFLATAAHEIRNPMTGIIGFTELLQNNELSQVERQKILSIMHRQASSLMNLMNDLLLITQNEQTKTKDLKLLPHSMASIIRSTLNEYPEINLRPLQLVLDDHLPQVYLDAQKFKQVLINLLSNAMKFSPEGSPIEVMTLSRTHEGQAQTGLLIKDHGIGMTAEDLKQLGKRFFRSSQAQTIKGTGLGFSVVLQAIDLMDADYQIRSVEGQGTEIELWFKTVSSV